MHQAHYISVLLILTLSLLKNVLHSVEGDNILYQTSISIIQKQISALNTNNKDEYLDAVVPNGRLYNNMKNLDWSNPRPIKLKIVDSHLVGKDDDLVLTRVKIHDDISQKDIDEVFMMQWKNINEKRQLFIYALTEIVK